MKLLEIALSQYGTKEIAGSSHNKTIINYAHEAGFDWVNDDETPWCSIFMNWCAIHANLPHSGKATARSWLTVGHKTISPQLGDIVVLKRGTSEWQGHVAIYINENNGVLYVLGGNQGNQVGITAYDKDNVIEYRRISFT